jgi:hemoglobin-like flavoprotein
MPDPNLCEAPMTHEQIQMVKTSFAAVAPIAEQAGMMFYDRLFTVDPSLRPLFKGDIKEQSRTLMRMIAVAVNGLDQLDTIVPAVQALGVRHAGYGVTNTHYDTVAGALLWTLGQGLGAAFTPEVEVAWVEAYTLLATTMRAAAAEHQA